MPEITNRIMERAEKAFLDEYGRLTPSWPLTPAERKSRLWSALRVAFREVTHPVEITHTHANLCLEVPMSATEPARVTQWGGHFIRELTHLELRAGHVEAREELEKAVAICRDPPGARMGVARTQAVLAAGLKARQARAVFEALDDELARRARLAFEAGMAGR